MKQFVSKLMLGGFILFALKGHSQQSLYVQQESERLHRVQDTEASIAQFISENMDYYMLKPELQSTLSEDLKSENNGKFDKAALNTAIDDMKRYELRRLYLKQHPDAALSYQAQPNTYAKQECVNGGFEDGLAGYTFTSNQDIHINECATHAALGVMIPPTNNFTTSTMATLISATDPNFLLFDPTMSVRGVNIPTLSPNGGNRCIKLNNASGGRDVTTMTKQMHVTDNWLEYEFSLLLQVSGHLADNKEPVFTVKVTTKTGAPVAQRCIIARPDCIFTESTIPNETPDMAILYTNWICDKLDVSSALNQDVIVEFTVTDCALNGHFGTVYIDNVCNFTCDGPAFGSLDFNTLDDNCENLQGGVPYMVCGNFTPPIGGTSTGMSLSISHNGSAFTPISATDAPLTTTGTSFCFAVNPALLSATPPGTYEFLVQANYNQSCPPLGTYTSSNTAVASVTFNCCMATLTSSSIFTGLETEQRSEWISSSDVFSGGAARGLYHAGQFVELTPGFETQDNSQFAAYIEGCTTDPYVYRALPAAVPEEKQIQDEEIGLIKLGNKIILSPNPSDRFVTIDSDMDLLGISVYTIDGKLVMQKSESGKSATVDVITFEQGVYIFSVETENHKVEKIKFIKK